jgi:protein phosphatase
MDPREADTVELHTPELAAAKYFCKPGPVLGFEFGAATHRGNWRPTNQDHYAVIRRVRAQQLLLSNLPDHNKLLPIPDVAYGMAVADGMGATAHGDLASQLAIRTAWDLASRATSWVMRLADLNSQELSERIEGFSFLMQKAFEEEFQSNPEFDRSGTTWTCAYLVSSFAVVAALGDSPCFLWRKGTMRQISTDHTVEQEFVAAGVRPEIAGKYRHVLTRCFASTSPSARPDVHHLRLHSDDQLLICTDGLTDMIDADCVAGCLDRAPDPQTACDQLIERALAAGGHDNVTAVLARAKA